jgi:GntR family transcriptional regulator
MAAVNSPSKAAAEFSRLDGMAAVPLYEVVKRHISEAIMMGRWAPGTVLPGEVALAQRFGVAVGTVRRALADLTVEGLLARRRKTGTIVTGRNPHHSLRSFFQYFRLHGRDGSVLRSQARVIDVRVEAPTTAERSVLGLREDGRVLRIHRLRRIDRAPVMRDRLVLDAERLPDFPLAARKVPELLYLHLLERHGIRISAVREQVTASLADADDLKLLDLTPPAAVLVIDEVAYDQTGRPTVIGNHRARTEHHCYVNEVR